MAARTLQAVAALAEPSRRLQAAQALAAILGAEDLVVFVRDVELSTFLPVVGFPKTLPNGRAWQDLVKRCATSEGPIAAELPYPDASRVRACAGVACASDAVLVLIGGSPRTDLDEGVRASFALLSSIFRAERTATAHEGHAAVARQDAARAEALATSLAQSQVELQRALRRLQDSEQWFSTTLLSIGDAVIATDGSGRVTFMNPVAERLTGFRLAEAKAKPLTSTFQILNEKSRASVEDPVERVLREGRPVALANHTILVGRDGSEISIDDSAAPIHDASGGLIGVVLVFRDVTSQRRAEREHDEQHRLAQLGWRVGASLTNKATLSEQLTQCTDAIVEHVDAAFARIWTLNEGDNVLELKASSGMYTHLDGPHARVPVGAFKIGGIAAERSPHLTNDVQNDPRVSDRAWAKREGMVSFAGYPLVVETRLVGVVALFARHPLAENTLKSLEAIADQLAVAIDRSAAEASLRRSELRYQLATRATRDAIWDWDLVTNTLTWNEGVQSLFGYSREQVGPGVDWWHEKIHPDDRARVVRGIHSVIDSGGSNWQDEYRCRRSDGTYALVFDRGYVARHPATGRALQMVGAMQDVGETKRREEFEKQLIGIVSHDLRNPLSAVLMGAEAILKRDELDERTTKAVVRIKSAAERARRMIRDLLDFTQARLSGGIRVDKRPTDLHELTRQVLEEFEVADPDRRIEGLHEGDGKGTWDADRVAQIVTNLMQNALTYSPPDTTVRVRTFAEDDAVSLSIQNEGAPIPAHRLPHLFEPLQRATEHAGTATRSIGLGLYIVKQLAEAHGGRITVESNEHDGTTFTLRLPRGNG